MNCRDNRRLWVMKKARRGFNCENLYTCEQDPKRFKEVENKIRSLHETKGEHILVSISRTFRSSSSMLYECIQA